MLRVGIDGFPIACFNISQEPRVDLGIAVYADATLPSQVLPRELIRRLRSAFARPVYSEIRWNLESCIIFD